MIQYYFRSEENETLHALSDFQSHVWIYVENPSDKELVELASRYGLEEGHLRDAIDIHEVPRLEIEGEIKYMYTRFAFRENGRIATAPVLIAMAPHFVLTVSVQRLPHLDKFLTGKMNAYTNEKGRLLIQLFNEIISEYNSFLTDIGRRVRYVGVDLEKIGNRDIVQFVSYEAILNDFLTALVPTQAILNQLLLDKSFAGEKDLVEDLFLGIGQLIEIGKSHLKNIVNIRGAYSTIVTNNLNSVIKLLTVLTVMLTIPMMIGSFYGMNVALPFGESPNAFWGVLAISFFISSGLLLVFRRNRWI